MNRTALLIIILFIGLFALFYSGPETAAAQSGSTPPTQDTYTSRNNPTVNLNGNTLLVSYDNFPTFNPSDFSYLQFDLSSQSASIAYSTLEVTIVDNLGSADEVIIGLYAINDDGWDANTLTHNTIPAPGAQLQTMTIARGFEGVVTFGDSNNAHPVGTFFETERMGDGIASLMLRVESVNSPDLFQGTLLMDDVEGTFDGQNGNEPALMAAESPTAISLTQVSSTAAGTPVIYLIIPFFMLGLMTLIALKRNR